MFSQICAHTTLVLQTVSFTTIPVGSMAAHEHTQTLGQGLEDETQQHFRHYQQNMLL